MLITQKTILAIAPNANPRIASQLPGALNKWLPIYKITAKAVVCMFLAQAAEETDGFKTLREYASGAAYEGRKDLGNTHKGDGVKFAGHGIFMETGRANNAAMGREINLDLVDHPELLQIVDYAVEAACQYWNDHRLTPLALAGDFVGITHRINGGLNGLAVRRLYLTRAQKAITSDIDIPKPAVAAPAKVSIPPLVGNGQPGDPKMNFLSGYKTHGLSLLGIGASTALTATQYVPILHGVGAVFAFLVAMAIRSGISAAVASIVEQILEFVSGALDSHQEATAALLAKTAADAIKDGIAQAAQASAAPSATNGTGAAAAPTGTADVKQ